MQREAASKELRVTTATVEESKGLANKHRSGGECRVEGHQPNSTTPLSASRCELL
jgi:hypothetical protein